MAKPGEQCGEFVLRREIGRGAMGRVYEAYQPALDRVVAVKVLSGASAADPLWVNRFKSEAAQAARLRHPGIVPVYAVGETPAGEHWFAMELIEGDDLAIRLVRDGPLAPREAARIIRDAALALQHAHEQGVVHRDVKPANLMLRADSDVVLTDFGLAKHVGSGGLTTTGSLVGTPYYMSPELVRGDARGVGPATDVYGLGVTLYELLVGQPPFMAENAAALVKAIVEQDPPVPSHKARAVHADLDTIVLGALEKRVEQRYGSAGELAAELTRYLNGEPILRRPLGRIERWRRYAGRHRAPVLVAATALALLGVLFFVFSSEIAGKEGEIEAARQELAERDAQILRLLAPLDDLLEKDGLGAAEQRLGELELAGELSGDEARRAWGFMAQRMASRLLRETAPDAKDLLAAREWVSFEPSLVNLVLDPPDASVRVLSFPDPTRGHAYRPVGDVMPDGRTHPGFYRFRVQAPGRHTSLVTLILPPGRTVDLPIALPPLRPQTAGLQYYAGVWSPPRGSDGSAGVERVLEPYYLAAHKVSERDYAEMLRAVQSEPERARLLPEGWERGVPMRGGRGEAPVRGVSAEQALDFAQRRGQRLPTEAEFRNAFLPMLMALSPPAGTADDGLGVMTKEYREAVAAVLEEEGLHDMLRRQRDDLIAMPEWVQGGDGSVRPSLLHPHRRGGTSRLRREVGLRLAASPASD